MTEAPSEAAVAMCLSVSHTSHTTMQRAVSPTSRPVFQRSSNIALLQLMGTDPSYI